jgi:hypothetical protein
MEFEIKDRKRLDAKYCSRKCYSYYLKQYGAHTKQKYLNIHWHEIVLFGLIILYGATILYFTFN